MSVKVTTPVSSPASIHTGAPWTSLIKLIMLDGLYLDTLGPSVMGMRL